MQGNQAEAASEIMTGTEDGASSPLAALQSIDLDTVMEYGVPVLGAIALLLVGWIVAGLVGRMVSKAMTRARLELTLSRFFGKLARWAILAFVVMGCLGLFGIEITAFAAVLAAMGFAIGMAFQGTLSNFSAGIMLLVFRPFKVGDVVTVGGVTGKVFEIDLFVTCLDTPDNRRLIVPNGSIFGETIENVSFHDTRRVNVTVGTAYDADIDRAREVLLQAAQSIDGVRAEPEAAVVLTGLGASSIDWDVRVWVNKADFWPVKEALIRAIKYGLDEAEIGIPFPQMDVHMTSAASAG